MSEQITYWMVESIEHGQWYPMGYCFDGHILDEGLKLYAQEPPTLFRTADEAAKKIHGTAKFHECPVSEFRISPVHITISEDERISV